MAIPDFQSLMRPLLQLSADGGDIKMRDAVELLSDEFQLADEERAQRNPSGTQTTMYNRTHWAATYLAKAGAIKRTGRGYFQITGRGRQLLGDNPERVTMKDLRVFPEFESFRTTKAKEASDEGDETASVAETVEETTPEDAIDSAWTILDAALRSEILERIAGLSPVFFERLVVDLVVAMGYGGDRGSVARRMGRSGDGGIDGIINEDPLGLDVLYLQAKRNGPDNTVGRDRIQQFAGALVGQGASRGVFVTTSTFTRGAVDYAERVPQRIILIDGDELARLMVHHGVGVRTERMLEIKRIDADFFDDTDL